MAVLTVLPDAVAEGSTPLLTGTFKDEADVAVQPTALTLTMHDLYSGAIVNNQDGADILSSSTGGALSFRLAQADTAILDPRETHEIRVLLLEWEWGPGPLKQKQEIQLEVTNLAKV